MRLNKYMHNLTIDKHVKLLFREISTGEPES